MLRKLRIVLAALFLVGITLLFCGIGAQWWGWMAKLQFLPSCLALNVGALAAVHLPYGRVPGHHNLDQTRLWQGC